MGDAPNLAPGTGPGTGSGIGSGVPVWGMPQTGTRTRVPGVVPGRVSGSGLGCNPNPVAQPGWFDPGGRGRVRGRFGTGSKPGSQDASRDASREGVWGASFEPTPPNPGQVLGMPGPDRVRIGSRNRASEQAPN